MTRMTTISGPVTGGVDTHGDTHHAAVIDQVGRELADQEFPATPAGYRALLRWLRGHGSLERVGVEGTGAFGAGLARHLRGQGVTLVEVDRPDRKTRRAKGKSDPIDAYAAARAALNGAAAGTPKTRDGRVEAIRALRVARRGAVKARTQAMNQLKGLIVTAPADLREALRGLAAASLIDTCARLRPGAHGADLAALNDPTAATKTTLRHLARRHQHLGEEIAELDADILPLVQAAAPALLALRGVGPEVAGQLLASAGDNPTRLRSEAAFAHLCGVAPIPASSGRTDRHRLNRGGDRAANNALHVIVLSRLRYEPRTQQYMTRRTAQGLGKKEIIRCLKRYVLRDIYRALRTPIDRHSDSNHGDPQGADGHSSIQAARAGASEVSTWSTRSAASMNDVDTDEHRYTMARRGTALTSTVATLVRAHSLRHPLASHIGKRSPDTGLDSP